MGHALLSYETKTFGRSPGIVSKFYVPRYIMYQIGSLGISYILSDDFMYLSPLLKMPLMTILFFGKYPGITFHMLFVGAACAYCKRGATMKLNELF